jgi:hypothetical protein
MSGWKKAFHYRGTEDTEKTELRFCFLWLQERFLKASQDLENNK